MCVCVCLFVRDDFYVGVLLVREGFVFGSFELVNLSINYGPFGTV